MESVGAAVSKEINGDGWQGRVKSMVKTSSQRQRNTKEEWQSQHGVKTPSFSTSYEHKEEGSLSCVKAAIDEELRKITESTVSVEL
ncbi:hypothetical protein L2E82_26930 [Cichorium intybus]|uniref:Uncharacterized protein n=1 Tax=Cichorium intybus TaxID=13427 RepID=A0ACB9CRU7_CICIN|nr:hypothetical protein L2E82_26930 [Cichorium intybus]